MIDAKDHKACTIWYLNWLAEIDDIRAGDNTGRLWTDLMRLSKNMKTKWDMAESARVEARRTGKWTRVQRYMDELESLAEEYKLLIFEAILRV
jgi:hypothetical protein